MSRLFIFAGECGASMNSKELLFAAEVAFAGGLIEEMPKDEDEAMDAFEGIGFDIEELE